MADGGRLGVQVALFCEEDDALAEKLAPRQLSLRLFSGFSATATVQLDLKDGWKEVRVSDDGKAEEVEAAPEPKPAKGGAKNATARPPTAGSRGAKLCDVFQAHAARIGARVVHHTTVSIALTDRGEDLYRKINARPYLAGGVFEPAGADSKDRPPSGDAKRAEVSRPARGFALDVSPLMTAAGQVHGTFVVPAAQMCGIKQIGFACSPTVSDDGRGPMISAEIAPTYSPITLSVDKVAKIPDVPSDVCSVIATFELAGVRRVMFGQSMVQPGRKCQTALRTVVLTKFLDAAMLKEDLASRSLDVEFHPSAAAVGVFSEEQADEYVEHQTTHESDGEAFLMDAIIHSIKAQRTLSPFASATISLALLLSTSNHVAASFGAQRASPYVVSTFQCKESLLPCKAQFTKKGMKQLAMSASKVEPQHIPAFLEASTTVTVSGECIRARDDVEFPANAGFQAPQEEAELCCMTGMYTRAVFVFRYDDDALLQKILGALADVNSAALPNIQGTIRSYVLTDKELEDVQNGRLDILCGFTVVDNDCRIIVVEGLADGGMQQLLRSVERDRPNKAGSRVILANPSIRFARRLYAQFGPDLKRIRLRLPLGQLCERSDVYSSHRVDPACSVALTQLQQMKSADSLKRLQQYRLFPDAQAILQIESQYGQAVSKRDMDGASNTLSVASLQQKTLDAGSEAALERSMLHAQSMGTLHASFAASSVDNDDGGEHRARRVATQCRNPEYEEHLKMMQQQPPKDFLGEQRQVLAAVRKEYEAAKARREAESATSSTPVYMYSTQALSSVEQEKARMRERLAKQKNVTFTYSSRFTSQTISLVDATRIKQDAELASRAKWKTQAGFVYPAPRTREELIAHPHKPDATRIDDLREPWEEPVAARPPERFVPKPGQKPFDAVPSNMPVFGGYKAPRFEREYSRDDIGNPKRLPRGRMVLEKNPEFFSSVHLVGTKLAQEQQEVLRRDRELWRSKVVVDNLSFRVDGFQNRDRTLQLDRTADILHDPPMTKALKKVRNARLPSGKIVPLEPAPLGVLSSEPFVESTLFAASLRPTNPNKFTVTTANGQPKDFVRYIRESALDQPAH